MHHLDGTAGETEGHGPKRGLTGPVGDNVERGPTPMLAMLVANVGPGWILSYRAYWITFFAFSSLGRGISLRGLARPPAAPWGVRELALRRAEALMAAAARKGTREVVGLTACVSEASVEVAKTRHRGSLTEQTGVYNAPRRAIEAADRVEGSISTGGQNVSAKQSRG